MTANRMWPGSGLVLVGLILFATTTKVAAQASSDKSQSPAPLNWNANQDHQNMMDQLGIKALRPGPSGNENAPNHANYDESKANPFPDLPDPLTLKNGQKVTTPQIWWDQRRPEIVDDLEREMYGRIPKNVPKVTWSVVRTANWTIGGHPVTGKQLDGQVDNSSCPEIKVDISMTVVVPADAKGPVPVMMMFGFFGGLPPPPGATQPAGRGGFGARGGRGGFGGRGFGPPPGSDPPSTTQLIADGWGYVLILPNSIQADNGAGLTKGIIGLVNKGQPRKPDDWGALRAWGWGASRGLDYLENDPAVDAKHVGIEGVSRYGKAALVTMAFDQRFALVLIGSSGEGGAKLSRRNWGEAVESLTGTGEYHWMAGNFLKYGASQATFGSKNPGDLPVDSHDLIALCAPRLTFVSYGIPERGDAKWLDHEGSYMAAVAAGKVFRLLGAKDLGVGDDYKDAKMPPVNTGLLDSQLAWRQHDGGHTDGPNWKYFIPWADKFFNRPYHPAPPMPAAPAAPAASAAPQASAAPAAAAFPARGFVPVPADQPVERRDPNSQLAHQQLLAKARKGGIDVYFEGDSITRRWGATDYPQYLANWKANFFGWNAGDFGWGGDTTQNILWRLQNGELDNVNPKVIVLLAGTNNVGGRAARDPEAKAADVTRGIGAILSALQSKAPHATIILTAIFPRNDSPAAMKVINLINDNLAKLANGKSIRFLNVNDKLADSNGQLFDGMMNPDHLHPALKGYQVWADGLKPMMTELLGPPAATDHAPEPTGDPSARK